MRRSRKLAAAVAAVLALCSPSLSGAYDWNAFHGGAAYSRETLEIVGTPQSEAWRVNLAGGILASPVIHNGRVYAATRIGSVYCLDAASGAVVWQMVAGMSVHATPTVAMGRLFVATGDGVLLCLDAATGAVRWRRYHGGETLSSPLVTRGMVVIGAGAPYKDIAAFSAASGEELWRVPADQCVYSSAFTYRGMIYIGSSSGAYLCIDPNGRVVWRTQTDGGVQMSSPELRYGRCYAVPGHFDPNCYAMDATTGAVLWAGNPVAPPAPGGTTPVLDEMFLQEVLSQDPADREAYIRAWSGVLQEDLSAYQQAVAYAANPDLGDEPIPPQAPYIASAHVKTSSPAVGADHVVFVHKGLAYPDPRWAVVCMNATTGVPQWWYQEVVAASPVDVSSTPAISLDRVFVGVAHRLYTFDLSTGRILDTRTLDGPVYSSPAVGNGLVVAATLAGTVYAFQSPNHAPSAPAAPFSPADAEDVLDSTPTLSWSSSSDPDPADGPGTLRYLVEVDTDGDLDEGYGGQYATLAGQTSLTLPEVAEDVRLVWRVRAVDPAGALSPWSPVRSFFVNRAIPTAPLLDPLWLNAVPQDAQVLLVWQARPGQTVDGYRLSVRDEFGSERTPVQLGPLESTTVAGLSNFVRYTFRIAATRASGAQSPGIEAVATPRPLISVGNESFATVEAAVAAAKPGDTVLLGTGTITATDLRLTKGVSLQGVAPGYTILQGADPAKPVVTVASGTAGQPPVVSMMTITRGSEGVLVEHGGRAELRNLILMGLGHGARLLNGARSVVVNNTISDNTGHGIWLDEGAGGGGQGNGGNGENVFRNNIVSYNGGWGLLGPDHGQGSPEISSFSDFFANALGAYGGTAAPGIGELAIEPCFAAKAPGDYRLKPGSPCIDAGDPADPFDQEPPPNGGRVDMGAYGNTPYAALGGTQRPASASVPSPGCFLSSARAKPGR